MTASAWDPQVFAPYDAWPDVVFARVAARSPQFDAVCAAGDRPIVVGSAAGHRRAQVAASARGELLERVGNILAGRTAEANAEVVATYADLRRKGIPAVDPADLAPAGSTNSVHPEAVRTTRRLWVLGRSAHTGDETHVPAGAVFLHHRPPADCDPGPRAGSTGIAAHPDQQAAAEHAAWEVLERDLVRRSWYGLSSPAPATLPTADLPSPLVRLLDGIGATATALDLPAPNGTRCAVVCLHAPDGTRQAFGARCGTDPDVSALVEKAAYEALMVRWSMGTRVALDTWSRWGGSNAPDSAVQHALWAYHVQDSLSLWIGRASPDPRPPNASAAPGTSAASGPLGTDRPRRPTRDRGDRAADPVDPVEPPSRSGLDALSAHTGRDIVLVDTTSGPPRAQGTTVVRVVAPGAEALPTGPADDRGRPTPSRPHPFG